MNFPELVSTLSIFLSSNKSQSDFIVADINIPSIIIERVKKIEEIGEMFHDKELKSIQDIYGEWFVDFTMLEPAYLWASLESIHIIYNKCDIYDGNFIRNIIRLTNLVEKFRTICEKLGDDVKFKTLEHFESKLIRDQVNMDSLYVSSS